MIEPSRSEKVFPLPVPEGERSPYFILDDELPARRRFLASMISSSQGGTSSVIVDFRGRIVRDFGSLGPSGGFQGTSISPDGRYVLGQSQVDDGHFLLQSTLLIADLHRGAPVPLDGPISGTTPKLSHSGSFLAFTNLDQTAIHVGRLVIRSR
jgi:hypothetical protein